MGVKLFRGQLYAKEEAITVKILYTPERNRPRKQYQRLEFPLQASNLAQEL